MDVLCLNDVNLGWKIMVFHYLLSQISCASQIAEVCEEFLRRYDVCGACGGNKDNNLIKNKDIIHPK